MVANFTKYKNADGTLNFENVIKDMDLAAEAGTHWVRWSISPNSNLEAVDKCLDLLEERGIKVIFDLVKTNPDNMIGTPEQEEENKKAYRALVERYKDRVRDWEIGNEPNLGGSWNLAPTDAGGTGNIVKDYILWLKGFYEVAKDVDPNINVVLGGISEWVAEPWFDRFGEYEGYLYCDEVCFHPYANTPEEVAGRIRSVKEHIAKWPEPYNNPPMWITEVGFHTEQIWTVPSTVPDDVIKANYVKPVYDKIFDEMGENIRPILWYMWAEGSESDGYGLVTSGWRNNVRSIKTHLALDAYAAVDDVTPREKKVTAPIKPAENNEPVQKEALKYDSVSVKLGEKDLEQKGIIKGGVVFLPLRAVCEELGAAVEWDEAAESVIVTAKGGTLSCKSGDIMSMVNGVYVKTEATPEIYEGLMMIPIRLAENVFGIKAEYSDKGRTVVIP